MTRMGTTLREWEGGRLDSRSLARFVKGLGPDSAFFRAAHPDEAETIAWLDGRAACALIAELIDVTRAGISTLAYKNTGKRPPKMEPYRRPWSKRSGRRYGSKPIPIKDFKQWYYGGDA